MNNFISILEGIDISKIPDTSFTGNLNAIDFIKPSANHYVESIDSTTRHTRQEFFCFEQFPQFVCMHEVRTYQLYKLNLKTSYVFYSWGNMMLTLTRTDESDNSLRYYVHYPHIKIPDKYNEYCAWGYQITQPVVVICASKLTKEKEGNTLCVQRKYERSDGLMIGSTEWCLGSVGFNIIASSKFFKIFKDVLITVEM